MKYGKYYEGEERGAVLEGGGPCARKEGPSVRHGGCAGASWTKMEEV